MADRSPRPAPKKTKKGSTAAKGRPSRGRRIVKRLFLGLTLTLLLALIAGFIVVGVAYNRTKIPDPNKDFQTNTTFVYYRDGKTQLGNLAVQNRQSIDYKEMPQNIKDAVVAAENRTFWTDRGISPTGMLRAAWTILRGGDLQGGSTITQQYIKIYYLNSERSVDRKFKELLLAVKLSREVSKEQILEGYLNTIYFGRGAYGVQAASKAYFNTDAKNLTDAQAAVLASVLNNPGMFDPSEGKANKERLLERYRYVLQGMAEMGALTPAEEAKAAKSLPKFPEIPTNSRYGGSKGFLMKMVEAELPAVTGLSQAEIAGGGYQVTTTFDDERQADAVKACETNTEQALSAAGRKDHKLHCAIASVDVGSGEVLAIYGGHDYVKNSRNWATTPRPTGSTFKAFAVAAGLRDGFSLRSVFNGDTFTPTGTGTPIRNEFSMQYGPVSLLRATADSINTAFVDMTTQMEKGPSKIADAAQDAGAPKGPGWDTSTDRISLGIPEVSPLNMAGAYATFAANGKQVGNHVIKEVKNADGKVIFHADTKGKQVFTDDISHDVNYALANVVEQGTGREVSTLGRPVAGKTGTAGVGDDVVSAWFVAYTKQISTSVMYVVGDSGTGDLDPYARPGDSTFFGGTYPAMTWRDYMAKATAGQEVKDFGQPAWVNAGKARNEPTVVPTRSTAPRPSSGPTSAKPTKEPTTTKPTTKPTTTKPTTQPTTTKPTTQPTSEPTTEPTTKPTTQPTTSKPKPTTKASRGPTSTARARSATGGG